MSYNESLNSNSNYPYMTQSQWDDAPWNQSDPDPVKVEVCVSYSISKSTKINTTDYKAKQWEDFERGDEGELIHTKGIEYDFSDSDLKSAYLEEITLEDILQECINYAKTDLENCSEKSSKGKYLQRLINACKEWHVDELIVVEE